MSCRTAHVVKLDFDALSEPDPEATSETLPGLRKLPQGSEQDGVPIVGRQEPISRILQAATELLRRVEQGRVSAEQADCALWLVGPRGSGKTRVLREAATLLSLHGHMAPDRVFVVGLASGSHPLERMPTLSLFRQILRGRCEILPSDPPTIAREKLLRTCRALLSPVRASEASPHLAELLGVGVAAESGTGRGDEAALGPVAVPLTPQQRFARGLSALSRFLAADASRSPLALFLDDLHLLPSDEVVFFQSLRDSLRGHPVLWVISARTDGLEQRRELASEEERRAALVLQPLSATEAQAVVGHILSMETSELPGEVCTLIERCAGQPASLLQLGQLLLDSGCLDWSLHDSDSGQGQPRGVDATLLSLRPPVPSWQPTRLPVLAEWLKHGEGPSLDELLWAHLSVLPPPHRLLLEQAAVCGEHVYLDALCVLARYEQVHNAEREAELHSAGSAAEHSVWTDPTTIDFADRESLLLAQTQDTQGRQVAECVDNLVARGFLQLLPDSLLPRCLSYRFSHASFCEQLVDRQRRDRRRQVHQAMSEWVRLTIQLGAIEPSHLPLWQESLARHCERAGQSQAAATAYHEAALGLSRATDREQQTRASRLLLRGLSCLEPRNFSAQAVLWRDLGKLFSRRGEHHAAAGAYSKLLAFSHIAGCRPLRAQAHAALGRICRHQGEPMQALEHLRAAHDDYQDSGDLMGVSDVLDDLGQVLWLLGRIEEALDRSARALELRRRIGSKQRESASLRHIGYIELHRGLLEPAWSCFEEAKRKHHGDTYALAAALLALGRVLLLRGELVMARAHFDEALLHLAAHEPTSLLVNIHCAIAEVAMQEGLVSQAAERLAVANELALRLTDRRAVAEIRRLWAYVALQKGEVPGALRLAQQALEQAQKNGVRHEIARALLALAAAHAATVFDETSEGRHPAWDCFQRSIALLREAGDQAELALALYQLGFHLVERGRVNPARATLREAGDLATRLRLGIGASVRQILSDLGEGRA